MSLKDLSEYFEKKAEEYTKKYVEIFRQIIEDYKKKKISEVISYKERVYKELKK